MDFHSWKLPEIVSRGGLFLRVTPLHTPLNLVFKSVKAPLSQWLRKLAPTHPDLRGRGQERLASWVHTSSPKGENMRLVVLLGPSSKSGEKTFVKSRIVGSTDHCRLSGSGFLNSQAVSFTVLLLQSLISIILHIINVIIHVRKWTRNLLYTMKR